MSIKPSVKVKEPETKEEDCEVEEKVTDDLTAAFLSSKDKKSDKLIEKDKVSENISTIKPLTKIKRKVADAHKLPISEMDDIVEQAFAEVDKKHNKSAKNDSKPNHSALASVIKEMSKEPELSEQAKKVRQLLNN